MSAIIYILFSAVKSIIMSRFPLNYISFLTCRWFLSENSENLACCGWADQAALSFSPVLFSRPWNWRGSHAERLEATQITRFIRLIQIRLVNDRKTPHFDTKPESQGVQGCFSQRSKARRCSSAKPRLRRPCPVSPATLNSIKKNWRFRQETYLQLCDFLTKMTKSMNLSVEPRFQQSPDSRISKVPSMVSFPGTCNAYLLADVLPATQIESEETNSSSMGSSASQICEMTSIPSVPLWQSHVRNLSYFRLYILSY